MAGENTDTFALERFPDIARPIVVATKEDATRDRERDRRDTAQDVVVSERVQLAVCADVEKTAGCIVGACRESIAVREEPTRSQRNDLEQRGKGAYETALISDSWPVKV